VAETDGVTAIASGLDSVSSEIDGVQQKAASSWLKVGVVAAASGILGGLAAAWYYRKTLAQLQGAEAHGDSGADQATEEDHDYDI